MPRPTMEEMRQRIEADKEAAREAIRRSALEEIGRLAVSSYDHTLDVCPFCTFGGFDVEDGHDDDCPLPLIEEYIEQHGRPGFVAQENGTPDA